MDKMLKQEIIEKFRIHAHDNASSDVQIGLLTEEIRKFFEEFQQTGDLDYRKMGIKKLVERRKLLTYLSMTDQKRFESVKEKMKDYE